MSDLVPVERVESKIYLIRDQKVMLDFDLADLYQVPTKRLNEQVRRNIERFPDDFMFSLTRQEIMRMSQIATSFSGEKRGKIKFYKNVNAFTEQGVAMLSGILRSKRAVQANIAIMRAFVRLRQMLSANKELAHKLAELERKIERHDGQIEKHDAEIRAIFNAIRKLMAPPKPRKLKIGFITQDK